jgi:choline dehydrogenase
MGVPNLEAWTDAAAPTCFGTCQRRIINSAGRRCSTYHAFLPESLVRQRRNLTIVLGSQVQQVLLSNDVHPLKATGLVVEGKDGRLFTVKAKREIIISAGAIVTPQLLLLRYFP